MDEPTFINRDGMIADKDYISWLADVKQRFRSVQSKAMVRVNTAMLEFYWSIGGDMVSSHQAVDQLKMPISFGKVPWRHHVEIFTKSQSVEEALFYIDKTIEGNWSRRTLKDTMDN